MKLLYVSTLCSKAMESYLLKTASDNVGMAIQKFHRLLSIGISKQPDCQIEALSIIPVVSTNHKRRVWKIDKDTINSFACHYIPFFNYPIIKELNVFLFTLLWISKWSFTNNKQYKIILIDILSLTQSIASLVMSKLLNLKIVAIVTDIPEYLTLSGQSKTIKTSLYKIIIKMIIMKFDGYILLTWQMNKVVNRKKKPFIIMEGLVDIEMRTFQIQLKVNDQIQNIVYAGSLNKIYGIDTLLKAFIGLKERNLRLHFYGTGDMEESIKKYSLIDSRIVLHGLVSNEEIVKVETMATLLVNPRPSTLKLTEFSFPSKTLEYMASGRPVLMNNLPGMPSEYLNYVYIFDNESVKGYYNSLYRILKKEHEELYIFGNQARDFVLAKKNNLLQAERVVSICQEILL